jgi:hypothetical protein
MCKLVHARACFPGARDSIPATARPRMGGGACGDAGACVVYAWCMRVVCVLYACCMLVVCVLYACCMRVVCGYAPVKICACEQILRMPVRCKIAHTYIVVPLHHHRQAYAGIAYAGIRTHSYALSNRRTPVHMPIHGAYIAQPRSAKIMHTTHAAHTTHTTQPNTHVRMREA